MSQTLTPSAAELTRQQRLQATQTGWHQPTTAEIAANAEASRAERSGVPPTLAEIQSNAAGRGAAERK